MSDHQNKNRLFDDFKPVDTKDWKEKMSQDLKGLTFEKLTWKTNEGIEVKPFYTSEDLENLTFLSTRPGEYPYVRGTNRNPKSWEIRQEIMVGEIETANATALQALNCGATALGFEIPEEKSLSQSEFSRLLKDIHFDCISINFNSITHSSDILQFLAAETKLQNIDPSRIYGSINSDPLGYLTKTGRFAKSSENDLSLAGNLVKNSSAKFPLLKTLGINGHIFHNAGGTIIQELAFSLAIISDYLDMLGKEGLNPGTIAKSMQLNLATGPLYFMEIAKLRAVRLLFARLVSSWGVKDEDSLKAFINCYTSEWNQTVYEPYVNMLRSTTESMSAVLGGCDSLTVIPFDKAYRPATKFSERIARNSQIILKEEAWFDKVQDPAAGSYFIESLTDSIISEVWKLFLEIEDMGGYLAAFKAGEIQNRIAGSAALRDHNISIRKEVLLGTNQYPNPPEMKPEDFDERIAFPLDEKKSGLVAEPLKIYRGAETFEKLRITSEVNKQKVFLLTIGNPVWRKARAGFAANFFGCAGFEIIDNPGFDTLASGIKDAIKSKAGIVVLCSSDEEYETLAPEVFNKLDKKIILVVAGYPKDCIDELKEKGINNFIHMRSNLLEELEKYQKLIGM